jgi:ribosome-associated protein
MIRITDDISIDESELTEEFTRSGGPGGQHVNKVSTAVQLRFDIPASTLPLYVKERLKRLGGTRVSNDGVLIISSKGTRQRERNRTEAVGKLVALIREAAERPKRRVKTRVSRAARERRLDAKKVRGSTKKLRGRVKKDDS